MSSLLHFMRLHHTISLLLFSNVTAPPFTLPRLFFLNAVNWMLYSTRPQSFIRAWTAWFPEGTLLIEGHPCCTGTALSIFFHISLLLHLLPASPWCLLWNSSPSLPLVYSILHCICLYIYINIYICIASFPSYVYPLLVVICIWGHRVLLEVWMLISLLNQQFYSLCLQDKFCSLGPNLVCSVLPARGDVLMVGHFSGLTVAHTASLVAWKHTTQQNSNNQSTVYVCVSGTEARRQEIQQVVTTMGCKSR